MGCDSNFMNLSDGIQRLEYLTARMLTFGSDLQRSWLCCLSNNSIRTKFHVGGFNHHIRPNTIPYTFSIAQNMLSFQKLIEDCWWQP